MPQKDKKWSPNDGYEGGGRALTKTKKAKKNKKKPKPKSSGDKAIVKNPKEVECLELIVMCGDDDVDVHSTSSLSQSEDDESGDEDEPKELEAHQFEWHTAKGLLEGLSFHYDEDAYMNKSTGQQIDLLVKKYTPTQLKPVFMLLCLPLNLSPMDLNLNAITTKMKAGTMLKQLILPAIEGNDSDVDSGNGGKR